MKLLSRNLALLAGFALLVAEARAQFNSGSNGSYGAMNISQNTTLDMPADGVFHCTTVTVANGVTLKFRRNALNTPVYLLATGDVLVNGIIDANGANYSGAIPGEGGPGGFDGGFGGFGPSGSANRGGDGHGPGRGINVSQKNDAAHAFAASQNTNVYGNVLIVPMVGGSGGAGANGNPGSGGGGGGGAILIASNTKITVNGRVTAVGGFGAGSGSGGSIRLVAPTGGGGGTVWGHTSGGGSSVGRVRIDTEDPLAFRNLSIQGAVTRGTRMFVFPQSTPKLHIVEAAGTQIQTPATAAITLQLPASAPTSQTVRVRGEGFAANTPVQIVVVPEHSASAQYELVLAGNPLEASATINLPVGEPVRIEAWVR